MTSLGNWQPGVTPPNIPGGYTPPATMQLQAATPQAGVALINGTPQILQWTAPNDGFNHRVELMLNLRVTSAETGGVISIAGTTPDGTAFSGAQLDGGSHAVGVTRNIVPCIMAPGSSITIAQTALTAGAATAWIEIWGS